MFLCQFSDEAVTVLGLYYKLQTFFFIPLFALHTCIVPVLSDNYARRLYRRCKRIIWDSAAIAGALMLLGVLYFEGIPGPMIRRFTKEQETIALGIPAFPIAEVVTAVVGTVLYAGETKGWNE